MKESQPPDMRSRAPQSAGKLLLNKNGSAEAASYGQLPRVAAPSVYFGPWAGLISLLAAAPTAPPCFRRWRRSSPLLLTRGGFGMSAKFPLNEQSLFISWTVVLRYREPRQLDKVRCPEAANLCSGARTFAPYWTFGSQLKVPQPAKGSPIRGAGKADRL